MKQQYFLLGVLITVFTIIPANAVLLDNGDFESAVGPADGWDVWNGGPVSAIEHTSGGNPGQFVSLDNGDTGWAGWYNLPTIAALNVLGIPPGTTITLAADMKSLGGVLNAAGLKAESWKNGAQIGASAEPLFTITTTWASYSIDYTLTPDATHLIVSLMNLASDVPGAAHIGYDNAEVLIPGGTPALKPVPIMGGGMSSDDDVLSWINPDPNSPSATITADVFILESDVLLTEDPNLGPAVLDPGVVQVADDINDEFVDLSNEGFTIQPNKYYYWAVHVTDSEIGVVPGFTWNFQTLNAPPTNVSAGADQYLWLTMDDGTPADGKVTFTLTATYNDDGVGTVTTTWTEGEHETDPGTVVTIDSPDSPTTQVTIDNTGWFFFTFTIEDEVAAVSDTVNVGVYADACEAAKEDPDDIPANYPNGYGDLDNDCDIDMDDLAVMAATWLDCLSPKLGCL